MALLRLLSLRCNSLNEDAPDQIRLMVYRGSLDPDQMENYFDEGQTVNLNREYEITDSIRLELLEIDYGPNDNLGSVTIASSPTPPDGATAQFTGDDADYTLRYQVIAVTAPSTEGGPQVCEPPPDRSEFPRQPVGDNREATCGGTGQTWVELRYRYANGAGVPFAEYYIARSGPEDILARGALDANGFVHVEPLPADCSEIRFWFDNDPTQYAISREYKPFRHSFTETELDLLVANYLQSGVDWLWGAVQGDFNENPGMGQIAFNTILGLIPFVDQALDVRDLTANVILLIGDPSPGQPAGYLRWDVWLGALLCLIGCIPEVGTVIKGVGKAIFRFGAGAAAVLFRQLVEILNRAGLGNAVQWLRRLLDDIPGHVRTAGSELRRVLEELSRRFDRVISIVGTRWDNLVTQLRRLKDRIVAALRELPGAIERMIREWVEKLRAAIDGRQRQIGSGSTENQNLLTQGTQPVPRGNQPPGGAPVDPNVQGNPGGGRPRVPHSYSTADARRIIDDSEGRLANPNNPNTAGHARAHVPTEGQDARALAENRTRPNGQPYEHNHTWRNGRQGEQDLRDVLNRNSAAIDAMQPGEFRRFDGQATSAQRQGYYSHNGQPAEEGFFSQADVGIIKQADGSIHLVHFAPNPGSWSAGAHR